MNLLREFLHDLFVPDPRLRTGRREDCGRVLQEMAPTLGFTDEGPSDAPVALPPKTPLLEAGESGYQRYARILRGPLGGDARTAGPCALAAFVYQFSRSRDYGWNRSNVGEVPCVLIAVELAMRPDAYAGIYVRRKEPLYGYSGTRLPFEIGELHVDDEPFEKGFDVRVLKGQDRGVARDLLSPALTAWLAERSIQLGFEVAGTWLCTFVEWSQNTEAEVVALLEDTRTLAPAVAESCLRG